MYCSGCGLALPSEALSCSSCGKRCIQDEPVSDPVPEATLLAAEGHPLDGRRSPESDSPTKPESGVPSTVGERNRLQRANAGSITLGAVALICLALGAVQGFIPIFLIEGAVFGGRLGSVLRSGLSLRACTQLFSLPRSFLPGWLE